MLKVSKKDIRQGYKGIKHLAKKAFKKGDVEKSLEYINNCVTIAQQFNFIYSDYELEALLKQIGEKVLPEPPKDYEAVKDRVVFYDEFCVSFVLAIQYIEALVASGKEIIYLYYEKDRKFENILNRIVNYPKLKIVVVRGNNQTAIIKELYKSIIKYQPEKILLHIEAKSIIVPVLYHLPEQIDRYIVNLADQTFWLGTGAVDYVLEFRQFGVSVSQQRRKINPRQQLLVPFYPVVDGNLFQGLPEGMQKEGKVVIFSGSDLYKVLDEKRMYWHLVKRLLDTFPDVVFWFATKMGGGDIDIIKRFIRENHYEGRFFYTSFRPDINEVLAHVDIFMGTCPVCGSLMSQLAARNATPILQYYYPGTPDDETEQAICVNEEFKISFDNEVDFMAEAEKLVYNPNYRKKQGERLHKAMVSPEQFNQMVAQAIDTKKTPIPLKPYYFDYNVLDDRWFELEKMGHIRVAPFILGLLGKRNSLKYVPLLFMRKVFNKYSKNS
jgi:hypothetical protein